MVLVLIGGYLPAAQEWPLANAIITALARCDTRPEQNDDGFNDTRARKFSYQKSARNSLESLANTRCQVCAGFGHSRKVCPTGPRLTTLMSCSALTQNTLAHARSKMVIAQAHHLDPKAPDPKISLPYKRRRTMSGASHATEASIELGF